METVVAWSWSFIVLEFRFRQRMASLLCSTISLPFRPRTQEPSRARRALEDIRGSSAASLPDTLTGEARPVLEFQVMLADFGGLQEKPIALRFHCRRELELENQ